MAQTYSPEQIGVEAPSGGFQTGGWYQGRQYWNGSLSEPGVIHPSSNQQGAGTTVSPEVNAQSAALQGVSPQQLESFLQAERDKAVNIQGQQSVPAPGTGIPGAGMTGAGIPGGMPVTGPEAINLPELYQSLMASSGIGELETQLSGMEKEYIEAKGEINDNPFLSEATRVGRIAKIEELYQDRTANIRGDVATKKADVEMQLDLQSRQFDINSQVASQALDQLNTLLSIGALDSASGEDIAGLTRATGISSSMIQSAISTRRQESMTSEIQTFDDGTNEGFVIYTIDPMGNIVNQTRQVTGPSSKAGGGKYSDDPAVNKFIEVFGSTEGIAEIWEELY